MSTKNNMTYEDINDLIELAWRDEVPFQAIKVQTGYQEQEVIRVMRRYLKRSSFKMWRKRVTRPHARKSRKQLV